DQVLIVVLALPHRQRRLWRPVAADWALDLRCHRQHLRRLVVSDDRCRDQLCGGLDLPKGNKERPDMGRNLGLAAGIASRKMNDHTGFSATARAGSSCAS